MGVFQYEKVKDPTYYGENRVPAHSDHRYYGSVEEMEQHVENFRHSLNGLWKFHYAKNYESTIPGFETPEYDCTKWDDIRVPAHIQMEGYDAPQYANVQYPWEGREEIQPGEIPERFNPTASYVKYFEVPERKTAFCFLPGSRERYCRMAERNVPWLQRGYVYSVRV